MHRLYTKEAFGIRTLEHLSLRLSIPLQELAKIAFDVESLYDSWKKPKENGKFRDIFNPRPRLKKVQSKIHKLLQEIILPDSFHGGVKRRSNITNAKIHCGQNWIFSLDFEAFFDNISHHRVYNLFRNELDCSPNVARLLTRICTIKGKVPQGAPMSSDIAILVCKKLGKRLEGLAKKYNIKYSHYIDDISFSGSIIPVSFKTKVKEIIAQHGFKLNSDKELICSRNKPQIVTGLSVNRKTLHLPRAIKRDWRAKKYIFKKYRGTELTEEERRKEEQKIQGRESYLRAVSSNY
jgi:RNA-directed DNA polymerase